jgi:UDP-GlcNAc:undecaprenyl-phosphate/decaprenyl-phosphate GlcNAc-1-phosphate transferase
MLLIGQTTLLAAIIVIVAVWPLRKVAPYLRLVDVADERRLHGAPVPNIGGLAMCIGLMAALFAVHDPHERQTAVVVGSLLIVAVGAIDDALELSPLLRFIAQIAVSIVMILLGGSCLHDLGHLVSPGMLTLGMLAIPFTVFAVVGAINAINMADGLDGLAGGLSLIAVFWFSAAATFAGKGTEFIVGHALGGALIGFLIFNLRAPWRPKAALFMGDAGSMLLGFLLAWMAIDITQGAGRVLSPIAAVWIMGVPLADTVRLMIQRKLKGKSAFKPDRNHLHHLLLDRGMSVSQAVAVLHCVAFIMGGIGVMASLLRVPDWILFYGYGILWLVFFFKTRHRITSNIAS